MRSGVVPRAEVERLSARIAGWGPGHPRSHRDAWAIDVHDPVCALSPEVHP